MIVLEFNLCSSVFTGLSDLEVPLEHRYNRIKCLFSIA